MANVLKVFLENGQTKSFKYNTTTTVQVGFLLAIFVRFWSHLRWNVDDYTLHMRIGIGTHTHTWSNERTTRMWFDRRTGTPFSMSNIANIWLTVCRAKLSNPKLWKWELKQCRKIAMIKFGKCYSNPIAKYIFPFLRFSCVTYCSLSRKIKSKSFPLCESNQSKMLMSARARHRCHCKCILQFKQ